MALCFLGKTEELIRRLKRARIARLKTEIYKPIIDIRYHKTNVVSHDENSIASIPVPSSANILLLSHNVDVVGIDEAQFFDDQLVEVCNELANRGTRVVVAGLDMDFKGDPFGPMPELIASAEFVTKVHAICVSCGSLAQYSHRVAENEELVLLGEKKTYIPLCRNCFNSKSKKK